jgi:hypothetical protein
VTRSKLKKLSLMLLLPPMPPRLKLHLRNLLVQRPEKS